jgi:prepilin-type N-terminal cleavage/methylation domain-containing protein
MKTKGFTLIEMLVVIVMVGMVAAVVVPYLLSGSVSESHEVIDLPAGQTVAGITAWQPRVAYDTRPRTPDEPIRNQTFHHKGNGSYEDPDKSATFQEH